MNNTKNDVVSLPVRWCLAVVMLLPMLFGNAQASDSSFAGNWSVERDSSSLIFQSLKDKNGIKSEFSSFTSFSGSVDDTGMATLRVDLDSVDTKVDLRNVRMRFLFFQTFKFAQATVTAKVDKTLMADLARDRRVTATLDFELDLHGVVQPLKVDAVLTQFADDKISIASKSPVSIATSLFGMDEGVAKLEDAAKVKIVRFGSVSFDLVFVRNSSTTTASASSQAATQPVVIPAAAAGTAPVAVETEGSFSAEECDGRFEILSQTGAVYFRSGSSVLDPESYPLLNTVVSIVERCPDLSIVVAGHTDSVGSDMINLKLSIARADSVMRYMTGQGVQNTRVTAVGYGETQPVAPNDTRRNRGRNRRIEFKSTRG